MYGNWQNGIMQGGPVGRSLTESLMFGQQQMAANPYLQGAAAREPTWQERNQIMSDYWGALGREGHMAAQQGIGRGWDPSAIAMQQSKFQSQARSPHLPSNPYNVDVPLPRAEAAAYMGLNVDPGIMKWLDQTRQQTGTGVERLGIWQLGSTGGGAQEQEQTAGTYDPYRPWGDGPPPTPQQPMNPGRPSAFGPGRSNTAPPQMQNQNYNIPSRTGTNAQQPATPNVASMPWGMSFAGGNALPTTAFDQDFYPANAPVRHYQGLNIPQPINMQPAPARNGMVGYGFDEIRNYNHWYR